jgi:hypothetical protein
MSRDGEPLHQALTPYYVLQWSVTTLNDRAAGTRAIFAPAARWPRIARPAQRGR